MGNGCKKSNTVLLDMTKGSSVREISNRDKNNRNQADQGHFSGAGTSNKAQISDTRNRSHGQMQPERLQQPLEYMTPHTTVPGSIPEIDADAVNMTEQGEEERYKQNDLHQDPLCAATKTSDKPSTELCHNAVATELQRKFDELRNKEVAFNQQIDEYDKEIKRLKAEHNRTLSSSGQTQRIAEKYQDEILRLQKEIENLQLRLSRIASDHLTDNNPDIADLSDKHRAVKLGEQFGEIYCNEWTAAFESLTERLKKTERESIRLLFKILQTINKTCKKRAKDQLETLLKNVADFIGTYELPHNVTVTLKALKDAKKKCYTLTLSNLKEEIHISLTSGIEQDVLEDSNVMKYVKSVTEVCWLMNISDPPLVIHANCKTNAPLDRNYFIEYMSRGDTVDFLVWPALLLCKHGSILRKGIAEPK